MKKEKEKVRDKYWETEEGETIEFGDNFMRCYDEAGKLQFGYRYFNSKTGEKSFVVKYTLDREKLLYSAEGMDFLIQTLKDWEEGYAD